MQSLCVWVGKYMLTDHMLQYSWYGNLNVQVFTSAIWFSIHLFMISPVCMDTIYDFFLFQVHCSEFMEFAEVENLHDFYSADERFVHTQDQRGFYIVYDAALKDLQELENELLLVGSHFIQRNSVKTVGNAERAATSAADVQSWAGTDVDRVAVLLDLWTCEMEFLESKVQVE